MVSQAQLTELRHSASKKEGFRSRDWVLTKAEGDLPDRVLGELGFTVVGWPLAIYL